MTIPNTVRFVWTGLTFPYYARLAVESVLLADPGARVVIHTFWPSPRAARHWERTLLYERVSQEAVDRSVLFAGLDAPASSYIELLEQAGQRGPGTEGDLVRLAVLFGAGGVFLDFDVLMLRSLSPLLHSAAFVGEQLVPATDAALQDAAVAIASASGPSSLAREAITAARTAVPALVRDATGATRQLAAGLRRRTAARTGSLASTEGVYRLHNAVLGAEPGNAWIRRTLTMALEQPPRAPETFGAALLNRSWKADPSDVDRLPAECFYSVPAGQSSDLFTSAPSTPAPGAFLLHHAAGQHAARLDGLDEERVLERRTRGTFYAVAAGVQLAARDLPLKPVPFLPRDGAASCR